MNQRSYEYLFEELEITDPYYRGWNDALLKMAQRILEYGINPQIMENAIRALQFTRDDEEGQP
jgi:hypothetical protein